MKKYYFFKDYLISGDSQTSLIKGVATLEVDFARLAQELPQGAQIKVETLQTVVEGARFLVYGEYTLPVTIEEVVGRESIELGQILREEGSLPSIN